MIGGKNVTDYMLSSTPALQGHLCHQDFAHQPGTAFLQFVISAKDTVELCKHSFPKHESNSHLVLDSTIKIQTVINSILASIIGNFETYQKHLFAGTFEKSVYFDKFDSSKFFKNGLNMVSTNAIQRQTYPFNILDLQIRALKMLINNHFESIKIEPVLGFYHSRDFNIKAPNINSESMFVFDDCDEVSKKLKDLLTEFKSNGGTIYAEPVHSVPQTSKGKKAFYDRHHEYLEMDNLIECDLKAEVGVNWQTQKYIS